MSIRYSIIIPTLTKTEEHWNVLLTTLTSVNEHSKDCEVILVNDGSTFNKQAMDDFNIDMYIRHEVNKGIAPSWNDGLKVARGEYIAIINDDITVQEGWLDKLRQALEYEDDHFVSAPGVEGQQNGTAIEEDYQWFPGYCFMLRKETLEEIGYFDEQFVPFNYEDTDYWTRVLKAGKKLVRNYNTTITHLQGHVLHTLDYKGVSDKNHELFVQKHGFNPIPVFYEGAKGPWQMDDPNQRF